MSEVVCGVGVPHVPVFPKLAAEGDVDVSQRYARVAAALGEADPSLLVVVANDHLNAFFLDRLPTFAIALGGVTSGPIEPVPTLTTAPLPTDREAAEFLANELVPAGFDLLLCHGVDVDHSVMVPLHFLNSAGLPVVVLYINGFVAPLPTANRCHALGVALHRAIRRMAGDRRVAFVASGSFSQEVGGPRIDPGQTWSVPRPDWAADVATALAARDEQRLADEATPERLADAGNVAGELLSWLTVVGAVGVSGAGLRPTVDHRSGEAFAFATWTRS